MKSENNIYDGLVAPCYILEEDRLRNNLKLIKSVADETGVQIILAFKAFALWKTFPILKEYISATTASSLSEARLAFDKFGSKAHTFSPAYTANEIEEIARCSSHITFNSLTQYADCHDAALKANGGLSFGLRVNPEYSEVGTALYNPCAPGTRFGVTADKLPETLPEGIEGFHCHCHCESAADVFERTLKHITEKFDRWFGQIKWINFGGGHLMTRKDYDIALLKSVLMDFKRRYPHLKVILEPGSAFAWQTGVLVSHVIDIVEDRGFRTAILDVSFTCHMPDCLEMPYMPTVRGAEVVAEADDAEVAAQENVYRLGGNSCLAGDFMGLWRFEKPLKTGDMIVFEDMIHYTTVKTNMFNGISHPSIAMLRIDGKLEMLREYTYKDYFDRMD
ncbi:MAG: carboxynorspermidine decarboxylase [Prevotella sp.]